MRKGLIGLICVVAILSGCGQINESTHSAMNDDDIPIVAQISVQTDVRTEEVTIVETTSKKGDVNHDDTFNVADVILLQKWLLSFSDTHLADWKAADFCEDDKLDVFDLCIMKRELLDIGYHIDFQIASDQHFNGHTEEILKTASWSSEKADPEAVITSVKELENYLGIFFDNDIVQHYREIYDDTYFDNNIRI